MPETTIEERRNARVILNRLKKRYPDISTALDYVDPWHLLVATVLSAHHSISQRFGISNILVKNSVEVRIKNR